MASQKSSSLPLSFTHQLTCLLAQLKNKLETNQQKVELQTDWSCCNSHWIFSVWHYQFCHLPQCTFYNFSRFDISSFPGNAFPILSFSMCDFSVILEVSIFYNFLLMHYPFFHFPSTVFPASPLISLVGSTSQDSDLGIACLMSSCWYHSQHVNLPWYPTPQHCTMTQHQLINP